MYLYSAVKCTNLNLIHVLIQCIRYQETRGTRSRNGPADTETEYNSDSPTREPRRRGRYSRHSGKYWTLIHLLYAMIIFTRQRKKEVIITIYCLCGDRLWLQIGTTPSWSKSKSQLRAHKSDKITAEKEITKLSSDKA